MSEPRDEPASEAGREGDASPNRYDQLISENQFLLEKLHAEHDRRARLKLEAMLAETPAIHFELDQQQRIAYVNPTWSRELLHPVSDVLGRPLSDFVAPSHQAVLAAALTERTREDHTDSAPDICFIDREGRPLWMSIRFRLNRSGTISGNMQNVSVHRELENERLRTQKINSIGRFAAGFAHDFNNLLMAITANLDITRRKLESRDILL
ncbi:MAG: PAS domain-containing protein, partial [Planctomycetota bacterium]|nr:PAS domain-containing protein [Planctomycetota bacterium]